MRRVTTLASALVAGALVLTACGGGGDNTAKPQASGSETSSPASDVKVGLAYDIGGRGDQSFNDAAAAGLDKAKTELGVEIKEAEASAGEPESASGYAYVGPSGTDWVFSGALRFPGDVHALFDCGTCLPARDELEAIGTEGSLFLDDPWHCNEPVIELRRLDGSVERIELEPVDSYRLELENLADAAAGSAPLLLGRDDALGQARVLEALFRSAETGATVRL